MHKIYIYVYCKRHILLIIYIWLYCRVLSLIYVVQYEISILWSMESYTNVVWVMYNLDLQKSDFHVYIPLIDEHHSCTKTHIIQIM